MAELDEAIKPGSIVLYIYGSGKSDVDMIYYYTGLVGTPCHNSKRWLVDFNQQSFACSENELIWLMDQTEKMQGKSIRDILREFYTEILAATLRQLRKKQLSLNAIFDQTYPLIKPSYKILYFLSSRSFHIINANGDTVYETSVLKFDSASELLSVALLIGAIYRMGVKGVEMGDTIWSCEFTA